MSYDWSGERTRRGALLKRLVVITVATFLVALAITALVSLR